MPASRMLGRSIKSKGSEPLNDREYSSWFDQTYKDTYSIVKRVGQILLVHLCPALLDDIDELLASTYSDMSKKEWKLRNHPNIIGWLVVAFRYVVYHRIRAWYKEQRALKQLQAEAATARIVDPFQEAALFEETETLMRVALGSRRYELLYANKCKGVPAKDLAALTGRNAHAMRVALWRWQNICRKVLKSNGKIIPVILWLHVNIPTFLGVLR